MATGRFNNNTKGPMAIELLNQLDIELQNAIANGGIGGGGGGSTPEPVFIPDSPAEVTASGASSTSMNIVWVAVTGASSYDVYRGNEKINPAPVTTNGFTDAGLEPGTQYTWMVRAVNSAGASLQSTPVTATTVAAPVVSPPVVPTGLTVNTVSASTISLSWGAVTGASGYEVYRGGVKVTPTLLTTNAYTDSGLAASTQYTYTIKSVNSAGSSVFSNAVSGSTIAGTVVTPPPAPSNFIAKNATSSSMTLTWTAVSGAASYNVYRGAVKVNAAPITGASFNDAGLTAATSYTWTVRAVNSAGEGDASAAATSSTLGTNTNVGLSPMPTKIFGCYYEVWYTANFALTDVPDDFNVVYLFHARPDGTPVNGNYNNAGNGSFIFRHYAEVPATQVQACRGSGKKVQLTCGGAKAGFAFTNRTQSQNFVNSFVTMYNGLGGVDGLDINWFEAGVNSTATEMVWIAQQLKSLYGANFAITCPPVPSGTYSPNDRVVTKAMSDAGVLDYAAPQFYEFAGSGDPNVIKNFITEWVNHLGDPQKVVLGLAAYWPNSPTLADCIREWDAVKALYPNIRGMFCWSSETNLKNGNVWGSTMRARLGATEVVPPPPVQSGEQDVLDAFAYNGGVKGAHLDFRAPYLRQGIASSSAAVATPGQRIGMVVNRAGTDLSAAITAGASYYGIYGVNGTKSVGDFWAGLQSTTGGGSGQVGIGAAAGFYGCFGVTPTGTTHIWSDSQAGTNSGRFVSYNSTDGRVSFSVGSGSSRVVIWSLGASLDVPVMIQVWHSGTTISLKVGSNAVVTGTVPNFQPSGHNYTLIGVHAANTTNANCKVWQAIFMHSPLTQELRDGVANFVRSMMP